MKKELKICGKTVEIFRTDPTSKPVPAVVLNTYEKEGGSVYEKCLEMTGEDFLLIAVSDLDWDSDTTPWQAENAFGGGCYGGRADDYIKELAEEIVPKALSASDSETSCLAIAGYSLGGLLAIYSLYKTDIFDRAASASGSFWYPGFIDYAKGEKLRRIPQRLYFSLGDRESNVKNSVLRTVGENTLLLKDYYKKIGIFSEYFENEGNHFKDADLRTAKAICRIIEK